jgi:hypothetical protein
LKGYASNAGKAGASEAERDTDWEGTQNTAISDKVGSIDEHIPYLQWFFLTGRFETVADLEGKEILRKNDPPAIDAQTDLASGAPHCTASGTGVSEATAEVVLSRFVVLMFK